MSQPKNVFENLNKYEIKSAAIGMVLGDSNLQVRAKNARMQLAHSPKVRDYVQVKSNVLSQIPGVWMRFTDVVHHNRKLGKEYPQIRAWTNSHEFFTDLHKRLYKPKKLVTRSLLNSVTPIGLAFWYMDDGHLSLKRNAIRSEEDKSKPYQERSISSRTIYLNTQGFSLEENQLIVEWLKDVYGVEARVKSSKNKNWKIYMNTRNAKNLVDIVRDYVLVIPSMHYKIDFKYVNDNAELLKYNVSNYTMEEEHERLAPPCG